MSIIIDKSIMHGRPIIKGTRVLVSVVVGSLAAGMSEEEIIYEYGISLQDIKDCLKFSSRLIDNEQIVPLEVDYV